MRRNNLNHGTGLVAPRLRTGSVASSFAVSGGAVGTSRKYHNHTNTQTRLKSARTTNAPRHDTSPTSKAIRGGVTAFPIRANECVMPWAKPQLRSGTHAAIARVAVGKVAPSPIPRKSRAANRLASPPTAPVAAVAAHTIRPLTKSVRRAPNFASDQLEQRIRIGECR